MCHGKLIMLRRAEEWVAPTWEFLGLWEIAWLFLNALFIVPVVIDSHQTKELITEPQAGIHQATR